MLVALVWIQEDTRGEYISFCEYPLDVAAARQSLTPFSMTPISCFPLYLLKPLLMIISRVA